MESLDQLAILDEALDLNLDAIPEPPAVHLHDLDLPFDVEFAVLCPAIDVSNPAYLAGNTDTFAHVWAHAPLSEALEGLVHWPAFLTDEIAATGGTRSSLSGFAVNDDYSSFLLMQPIAHAGHDVRYQREGWRVVVGEWVVIDAVVDFGVWIARPFGAELPYRPVVAMLGVEELYERVEGIPVCALRICTTRSGSRNNCT
jgi:hypothetical protein